MPTSTGPFSCSPPALVTGEPVYRPRDDCVGDRIAEAPLAFARIVQAELRFLRVVLVWVMMGNGLVRPLPTALEKGIDYRHRRGAGQHLNCVKLAAQAEQHADRVGLVIRP